MKLTNRANKFSLTALAGLAVLSLTGAANADTTGGVSPTIGPFNTNFGLGGGANPITNLTLPTFDTTLGTLTGISFTVGGTVTTTFSGQDLSGNSNSITLTSSANISLYAPPVVSPATLIVFTIPSNSTSLSVAPNATFGPTSVVAPGSNTVASYGGSFLPFETVGAGTIVLPVTASGQSNASDSNGNISSSIRTTASAYGSVTYTYTPSSVPEPGSVAMLIAGGVTGAGVLVRRRKK